MSMVLKLALIAAIALSSHDKDPPRLTKVELDEDDPIIIGKFDESSDLKVPWQEGEAEPTRVKKR